MVGTHTKSIFPQWKILSFMDAEARTNWIFTWVDKIFNNSGITKCSLLNDVDPDDLQHLSHNQANFAFVWLIKTICSFSLTWNEGTRGAGFYNQLPHPAMKAVFTRCLPERGKCLPKLKLCSLGGSGGELKGQKDLSRTSGLKRTLEAISRKYLISQRRKLRLEETNELSPTSKAPFLEEPVWVSSLPKV